MKKALLLLSALILFGCGGGGSTTTSSNTGGGGGGGSNPVGSTNITLTITEGGSAASAKAFIPVQRSITVTTANAARIIFRNISTVTSYVQDVDINGDPIPGSFTAVTQQMEIYKRVVDSPYTPGGSVTVAVPPSPPRGYVVDVLTYYDDANQKYNMLKYGRSASNIVITPAGGSGSITVNNIAPTITVTPDPVISEAKYTVSVSAGMPLRNYYKIRQDLSDVSFGAFSNYSTHLMPGYFGSRTFTAPTTNTNGNLYMPAQFFIDDSMLGGNKNESYSHWTAITPVTPGIIGLISVTFTP